MVISTVILNWVATDMHEAKLQSAWMKRVPPNTSFPSAPRPPKKQFLICVFVILCYLCSHWLQQWHPRWAPYPPINTSVSLLSYRHTLSSVVIMLLLNHLERKWMVFAKYLDWINHNIVLFDLTVMIKPLLLHNMWMCFPIFANLSCMYHHIYSGWRYFSWHPMLMMVGKCT